MNIGEHVTDCPICPLRVLDESDGPSIDCAPSWGESAWDYANSIIQFADHAEVISDLGYEYGLTSGVAVAITDCAHMRQITGRCIPMSQTQLP
jgi:hypothetical protein